MTVEFWNLWGRGETVEYDVYGWVVDGVLASFRSPSFGGMVNSIVDCFTTRMTDNQESSRTNDIPPEVRSHSCQRMSLPLVEKRREKPSLHKE